VSGSYAYVASAGFIGVFYVIDVSVPSAPVEVAYVPTGGDAWGVAVAGAYAFVAAASWNGSDYEGTLSVIDVSTPSTPAEVGSVFVGTSGTSARLSRYRAGMRTSHTTTTALMVACSWPM